MGERNGVGSVVANIRIGGKVAAGFAAVLLILAVSSAFAYLAFGRVAGAVDQYAGLVARSAIFRDIDLGVTQYRGHAREYVFSNDEATADLALKDAAAVRQLVATGLERVNNPERRSLLQGIAKEENSYTTGFQRLHAMNLDQAKLESGVLDVVGPQLTEAFTTVITGAVKGGNTDLLAPAAEGRRLSLVLRLDVNKRLGRHDEAAAKAAEQSIDDLRRVLAQLDSATRGGELNAPILAAGKLIDTYQAAFRRAASLDTEQVTLLNGAMRQAGDAMAANAVKAKDSNVVDQTATEQEAQAVTASGTMLVSILAVGGLVVGVALAWLIGRGISHPVVRMCAAMRALAGGDKSVEIPGVGRKDEIGQMAETVAVFKHNMIEADRLRDETEQHKAAAEAERKTGMLRLADNFEAGIKGVVNSVASQATEMQAAAEAMTHTAEQATHQATAVAASVEEASTNVQTVASSAEELSSSVLEIGRQVEQSSKIACQAVAEADRTNTTVEGLDRTAQRIGEVVQLIETIAGQTTLAITSRMSRYIRYLARYLADFTRGIPMILRS